MLAIVPQMRLLLAIEPVDFRNHSGRLIIPSSVAGTHRFRSNPELLLFPTRNNPVVLFSRQIKPSAEKPKDTYDRALLFRS